MKGHIEDATAVEVSVSPGEVPSFGAGQCLPAGAVDSS